jgi:hypothetical protein
MLRITVREEEKKGRIQAAGKIAGPWVAELENAWRGVQAPGKEIEIDLKDVTYVDEAGRTGQDDLARANDNQIAALYSYNPARADLARATGQMEALYSK